ncbi:MULTISPECIES: Fic/DOC family protein [Rufibacter]|uniref:protein adenylyltransferase n=1 Tax=Rufibacter quisquiliarum TaxID=1549639 RepID=A0A839GZN3_9BACT|nr:MULTISPECIES: Fic family protein [Rufibacter]MBA9079141.1 fido (protein-threonine AMPylation protein) [Rufibacter quisquiliarum]
MAQNDGFTYENGTLINHIGIQNKSLLAKIENDVAGFNAAILKERGGIPGNFNLEHLQKIHKQLFQSVYPWAGESRAERGGFQGVKETEVNHIPQEMRYAPFKEIETRLETISKQLQQENNLNGLEPEKFIDRAAYYLDQYNHVHAFREGNGRTLQAAFTQLGREAGYNIDFSRADPAKYNDARNFAIVKPYAPQEASKNLAPLKAFLNEITTPLPGIEAERARTEGASKTPEPSAAMKRIEALRELEVTGGRIADRWDIAVKQQVKNIVEEPKNLKTHDRDLRTVSKAILEGGVKPDHYLYQDAERFTKALDHVKYVSAGKDIPALKAPSRAQQLQSGQPKNHTEAKELFIKASAIVSLELKAHGKVTEGERLQDVAKFVSKVPFVGGVNKAHVNNALDASATVPGLKEEGSVIDIKNAVSILEKPERAHSQGTATKVLHQGRGGVER